MLSKERVIIILFVYLLYSLTTISSVSIQDSDVQIVSKEYQPTWNSLDSRPIPSW